MKIGNLFSRATSRVTASHPLYDKIRQDHKRIDQLFKEIVDDGKKKKFDQLYKELKNHMLMEENNLYPSLEPYKYTHDRALHAQEEHKVAHKLLEELRKEDRNSERWMVKLDILRTNIMHHVREEEGQLLPMAHVTLNEEQENQLAQHWEKGVA